MHDVTIVGELVLAVSPAPHRRARRWRWRRSSASCRTRSRSRSARASCASACPRPTSSPPRRPPRRRGSSSAATRRGRRSARGARPSSTARPCSPRASRTSPATRRASSGSRGAPRRRPADGTPAKTSLAFWGSGDDSPGWLVRCLSEFAFRGVNLTKIESRPLRARLGHYRFFVDCEGGATRAVRRRGRRGPARALRAGPRAGLVSGGGAPA